MIFPRMNYKIFKPFESSGFLKMPQKFEKISRMLLSKHQNKWEICFKFLGLLTIY